MLVRGPGHALHVATRPAAVTTETAPRPFLTLLEALHASTGKGVTCPEQGVALGAGTLGVVPPARLKQRLLWSWGQWLHLSPPPMAVAALGVTLTLKLKVWLWASGA